MRAGAGVLILVTAVVVGLIARFAWRLRRLESAPHKGVPYNSAPHKGVPYDSASHEGVPYAAEK